MIRVTPIVLICLSFLSPSSVFALNDQGLSSVMDIIDRAVTQFTENPPAAEGEAEDKEAVEKQNGAATSTVVNLSRTLGKLSYSRLQCGQADVLAEFTQRVQKMPQEYRDSMRDAFQQGFDQSKKETPLLSEDECARLTQSRSRAEKEPEPEVAVEKTKEKSEARVEKPPEPVDPRLKQMRIAELSGQLAFKRKFCGDNQVVTRDFNEVISKMPEEMRKEARESYWRGYKHGKRLNKNLRKDQCY